MASTKQLALVLAVLVSLHLLMSCGATTAPRHHAKLVNPPCDHNSTRDIITPPPAQRGTPALMTVNGFQSGDVPAACDGRFHRDRDLVVALPAELYAGGRRCLKLIRITNARTGRTVEAKMVDECDIRHGCRRNTLGTSPGVWMALGHDTNVGIVPITWSDV